MKALVGLVGLVIVIAVILYLNFGQGGPQTTKKTLDAGQRSVERIGGLTGMELDPDGASANRAPVDPLVESAPNPMRPDMRSVADALSLENRNGKLVVTEIEATSALQAKFGLQVGDILRAVGPLDVETVIGPDPASAKAFIQTQFGAPNPTLVVMRGGKQVTLPLPAQAAAPAAPTPAPLTQTPAADGSQSADATTPPVAPAPATPAPDKTSMHSPTSLVGGLGDYPNRVDEESGK